MATLPPFTRRKFLQMSAGLAGLGCAACAAPVTEQPVVPSPVTSAGTQRPYGGPLIDSHSHVGAMHGYGEDELAQVMVKAGVSRVVGFGGRPGKDPRVIPIAYAGGTGGGISLGADLRSQLKDGVFRGQKMSVRHFPFPMQPGGSNGSATDAAVRSAAALAAETNRPLTLHLDGPRTDDLVALCREFGEAPIIWAHAGTVPPRFGSGASAKQVRDMLDAHPNLYIDLSARAPGWMGPISLPEWEGVFLAHPARILFGIDVFIARFLPQVPSAVGYWREILGMLPASVAEQVAYKNAERLFGA